MWRYLKFPGWSELDPPTRIRLQSTLTATADYLFNIVILFVFAAIGTVGFAVPLAILLIAMVINTLILYAIASGLTLRMADPSITGWQVTAACGINFVGMALAPQIAYMFIVNLFVPLSFGSLHFSRRGFLTAWCLLALSMMLMILALGDRIDIALSNAGERWLACAVLILAFGRFLAINAAVSRLRANLHRKNKELARVSMQLAELATRDEMTGLWNRRQFVQFVEDEINRTRRSGAEFCVALANVDYFSAINEVYGMQLGDEVLQELARLIEKSLRSMDRVGRYGGEEFSILMVDTRPDELHGIMDTLCRAVEFHDWERLRPGLQLTISVGYARSQHDDTHLRLLNRAGAALNRAKNGGRNQWREAVK